MKILLYLNLGLKPIVLIIALLLKIVNGTFYRYGLCFIRGEKRAIMWGLEVFKPLAVYNLHRRRYQR